MTGCRPVGGGDISMEWFYVAEAAGPARSEGRPYFTGIGRHQDDLLFASDRSSRISSRNTRRRIFPTLDMGISSLNSMERGRL